MREEKGEQGVALEACGYLRRPLARVAGKRICGWTVAANIDSNSTPTHGGKRLQGEERVGKEDDQGENDITHAYREKGYDLDY